MTEQEIIQKALDYGGCSKEWFDDKSYVGESTAYDDAHAFYDGAHSRDEEIKELKKSKGAFLDSVVKHKKATMELEAKLQELSNPWISVEEKLPEERKDGYSDLVLIRRKDNVYDIAHYCHKGYKSPRWEGEYGSGIKMPTYWMPIPKLQKEE